MNDEEQKERRQTVLNDARVRREQGSTLSQFATSEAETPRGRYTTEERATVIGITPRLWHAHKSRRHRWLMAHLASGGLDRPQRCRSPRSA